MEYRINIDINTLARTLNTTEKNLKKKLSKVLKDNIIDAYVELRLNTPIDTGELQDSAFYQIEKFSGKLGVTAEHAPYVEYGGGTPRKSGKIPFFAPTVEELIENLVNDLNNLRI